MCIIPETALVPAVKIGLSSAISVYKLYGSINESRIFQIKTKTISNQTLFAEGISLSNCCKLDYQTCKKLMLRMKEGN